MEKTTNPIKIDQIIRSKRRSIGLRINQDAQLIIRAPKWVSLSQIERIVAQKSRWITQKQEIFLSRQHVPKMSITLKQKKLYKIQALEYFKQRVNHFANLYNLQVQSIRINDAKTRWGSCSATNNINLCWRLILAPYRVIDYVIIHELMHIKQKNHSQKFWQEVQNIIPDYQSDEHWLKTNGYLLHHH